MPSTARAQKEQMGEAAKRSNKRRRASTCGNSLEHSASAADDSDGLDIDKLQWKQVQLPDRVGDLEGLMGFEEIDGIDVQSEYINGGAERIVKFKRAKTEPEETKNTPLPKSDGGDKEATDKQAARKKKKKKPKPEKRTLEESNTFTGLDPEQPEVELPEWSRVYPFSESLLRGLKDLGFSAPTEVQAQAIPLIAGGHDVVGKAPTGSGKTLAFGLPILEKYLASSASSAAVISSKKSMSYTTAPPPTALIFAPTRELVQQISQHIIDVSKHTPATIVSITGGLSIQKQLRQLKYFPDVVVATPGRLHELLTSDSSGMIRWLAGVEILVLDEADRLLQDGHFKELNEIIELIGQGESEDDESDSEPEGPRVPKAKRRNHKRQSLVFSATFDKDLARKITVAKKNTRDAKSKSKKIFSNPKANDAKPDPMAYLLDKLNFRKEALEYIDVNPDDAVKREVMEGMIMCDAMEKDIYLYYFLLKYPGRTIVFVNSIDAVKRISRLLHELGLPVQAFHSHMIQKQRLRTVERFRANDLAVLISTDVAARGLDVPHVDHVLHYHLPRSADTYIHRSGRTARGAEKGVAMVLCARTETQQLKNMTKKLGKSAKDLRVFDVDKKTAKQLADRVTLAQEIAALELKLSQAGADPKRRLKQTGDNFADSALLRQGAEDLGLDNSETEELLAGSDTEMTWNGSHNVKVDSAKQKDQERVKLQHLRADLKRLLSRIVITGSNVSRNYITSGLVNLARRIKDGSGHESFLGDVKTTALDDISKSRKNRAAVVATQ